MKALISVLTVHLMIDHQKSLPPDLKDFPLLKKNQSLTKSDENKVYLGTIAKGEREIVLNWA